MSGKKLSKDDVPQKFIEWMLAMGFPSHNIPSLEYINGICRGQYYMIWRSLMEHVDARDVVSHKRLSVFYDDLTQCLEKRWLDQSGFSSLVPEQLLLWKEHTEVKEMVAEKEARVNKVKKAWKARTDKGPSKAIQLNSSRQRIADVQRRSWLLRRVISDLTTKIANLKETKAIAHSLCHVEMEQRDIQNTFNNCIALIQQKSKPSALPLSTPVASSTFVSNHEIDTTSHEEDDNVLSLVSCRGDVLWPHFLERLSSLNSRLTEAYKRHVHVKNRSYKPSVLAHTAALHAILGVRTRENRIHFQRTHLQYATSIADLNSYVTDDISELIIVQVEKICSEARVKSLKALYEELTARKGVFDSDDDRSGDVVNAQATLGSVVSVNKSIIKLREELKRLLCANTQRKIYNIREYLLALFSALHNNTGIRDAVSGEVRLDFPAESTFLLCQFYREKCKRDISNGNLSFSLEETSDTSFSDQPFQEKDGYLTDNLTFVDELNLYLKKFNLEKNRKLVLDNGKNMWIFETKEALTSRLQTKWVESKATVLLHPSVTTSHALRQLHDDTHLLRPALRSLDDIKKIAIPDITPLMNQEAETIDRLKKQIEKNRKSLQEAHNDLDAFEESYRLLKIELQKYISPKRTINGKTYKQYEAEYLEYMRYNR